MRWVYTKLTIIRIIPSVNLPSFFPHPIYCMSGQNYHMGCESSPILYIILPFHFYMMTLAICITCLYFLFLILHVQTGAHESILIVLTVSMFFEPLATDSSTVQHDQLTAWSSYFWMRCMGTSKGNNSIWKLDRRSWALDRCTAQHLLQDYCLTPLSSCLTWFQRACMTACNFRVTPAHPHCLWVMWFLPYTCHCIGLIDG